MGWKTYLIIYLGTGARVSEVVKKVETIGFKSQFGPVDFVYNWGESEPSKEQVFALGDKLTESLNGSGAVFNLDTHD